MSKSKKNGRAQTTDFDFELVFRADGTVELKNDAGEMLWCSDSDDDFAEEFDGDFFDDDSADDILDYLDEKGLVDVEADEIDIVENDLDDEVGSDVIDADYEVKE